MAARRPAVLAAAAAPAGASVGPVDAGGTFAAPVILQLNPTCTGGAVPAGNAGARLACVTVPF